MKILYLKPAEGRLVRDPATRQPIPAWGVAVPAGPYWTQLRRDCDVVDTTAEEIAAAEAKFHADARAAAEEAQGGAAWAIGSEPQPEAATPSAPAAKRRAPADKE